MTLRDLRRFAPIGLYLSLLAALITAGLFIVQRSFTLPIQISLGVTIIGLALYVLLDPQRTREALTGRQARYGSNALLLTLAFAGIIIVINYLVNNNSKQWDLTEDKTNSLTTESIKTLDSLKSPVKAEAFFTPNMSSDTARTLMMNYKAKSQGKFDFTFVDPVTNPILAQQDNVTRDGTIVLKMDNRMEQVTSTSEEDITGALVRLANPGKRAVYFLTGHGEYVMDSSSENNYSQVENALTAKNYTVNTLNLLASPKIPDDALAIIVAGPTKPLSQDEIGLIKAYQEKGGSLVYLAEPRPVTEFGDQTDPMVTYLEQTWGIKLEEDLVVDMSSNQPLVAISQSFGSHAITQKMNTLAVVMPSARSVKVETAPAGVKVSALASTSSMAWGETDYQSVQNNQVKPDEGKDVLGPVNLAAAGENSNTHARVLVVGDSDFAGSKGYSNYGNSDFILNGIDWTAAQDNLISLTPRQPTQRFLAPPQTYTFGLILLGSVVLLPGLVLLTGITVWLQRRRRG
jgi:ABC-type uncharacterized transport system involved in gliding motility auxiliary subunit